MEKPEVFECSIKGYFDPKFSSVLSVYHFRITCINIYVYTRQKFSTRPMNDQLDAMFGDEQASAKEIRLLLARFLQIRLGNESYDQISASSNGPKRAKSCESRDKNPPPHNDADSVQNWPE